MYPILVTIEEGFFQLISAEGIDLGFLLRFAILKEYMPNFISFPAENRKNIRIQLQREDFFILNSICKENNCYVGEFAGDLIVQAYLDLIT